MENSFSNLPIIKMNNSFKNINNNQNNNEKEEKKLVTSSSQTNKTLKKIKPFISPRNQLINNNLSSSSFSVQKFSYYKKIYFNKIKNDTKKKEIINIIENKDSESFSKNNEKEISKIYNNIDKDNLIKKFLCKNISEIKDNKFKFLKPLLKKR